MAGLFPPIYFYIPQPYWQDNFPDRADENWQGFGMGIYAWTLQTYLRLSELVLEFPDEGIVLIHRNALISYNDTLKPGRKVLLICLKAELRPYPYAQLHLVQNPWNGLSYIRGDKESVTMQLVRIAQTAQPRLSDDQQLEQRITELEEKLHP
jgi:hypothetical protein